MPDLNDLLRWSIVNSTPAHPDSDLSTSADPAGELALRFNPASSAQQQGTSALHPSDPQYRAANLDDVSEASTPGPLTPATGTSQLPGFPRQELNTEILDIIMGKSDSVVMKEKMQVAMDEDKSVDERVSALDDFEMLIELIDNANNMAVLKMWEPLLTLLSSPHSPIVAHACWVAGTAVQNNLKAQAALHMQNALPLILNLIYPSSSSSASSSSSTSSPSAATPAVRAKATYALSSSLKHWPLASSALSASSSLGYSILARGVSDPDPILRRKMAFLVGTLVMQSGERYEGEIPKEVVTLLEERMRELGGQKGEGLVEGLRRAGVFTNLVERLGKEGEDGAGDVEFEENAVRGLVQALIKGGLGSNEVEGLKKVWRSWSEEDRERRGLGGEDGKEIDRALSLAQSSA